MTSECLPAPPSSFFARWLWYQSMEYIAHFHLSLFRAWIMVVLDCYPAVCPISTVDGDQWAKRDHSKALNKDTREQPSQAAIILDLRYFVINMPVSRSTYKKLIHLWSLWDTCRWDKLVLKGFCLEASWKKYLSQIRRWRVRNDRVLKLFVEAFNLFYLFLASRQVIVIFTPTSLEESL